jgi:hypothetical protein
MIRIMMSLAIVSLTVSSFLAEAAPVPANPAKMTIHGTIIDNACATANKDTLPAFLKSHTKDCALMPGCEASGYSIYTKDGKLHPFLYKDTKTIADFLKVKSNTLHAVVTAEMVGDSLKLETIKGSPAMAKHAEKPAKKTM